MQRCKSCHQIISKHHPCYYCGTDQESHVSGQYVGFAMVIGLLLFLGLAVVF